MVLQWRHNERDGVSNHRRLDCPLNRLFRHRSKKTPKLRVTGLCEGNLIVTEKFPAQMASNSEHVSIWLCHHGLILIQRFHRWNLIMLWSFENCFEAENCFEGPHSVDFCLTKYPPPPIRWCQLCLFRVSEVWLMGAWDTRDELTLSQAVAFKPNPFEFVPRWYYCCFFTKILILASSIKQFICLHYIHNLPLHCQ